MNLLVLGATGQTGQNLVAAASAAHHRTAFGRRDAAGVHRSVVGAFADPEFAELVADADAVVSCLASSNTVPVCSMATTAILKAKPDVRFLTVAGAAVDQPDDRKGVAEKAIGAVMRLVAGRMLADRQAEIDMLTDSGATWSALRPPRLVNGKATGLWQTSFDKPPATWIDRADLAAALLHVLETDGFRRAAPFIAAKTGAA